MERMLRAESELVDTVFVEPDWDPALRGDRRKYRSVMKRLFSLGLVRPARRGRAKEQAGIFFVKKKSKPGERPKRRLIFDARRVNQRFRTPPGVELCSSEGLSRLEVEVPEGFETDVESFEDFLSEVSVAVGSGDVKDCFHRFSSIYFGVGEGTGNSA